MKRFPAPVALVQEARRPRAAFVQVAGGAVSFGVEGALSAPEAMALLARLDQLSLELSSAR